MRHPYRRDAEVSAQVGCGQESPCWLLPVELEDWESGVLRTSVLRCKSVLVVVLDACQNALALI